MSATEHLKREHQVLRAELRLLEAAMRLAPEAPAVLCETCWSLSGMLEQHIQHEAQAVRPYRNRIDTLRRERMAREHADQQIVLRDVRGPLVGGLKAPLSEVVPPLTHLIEELRAHMEEEERELFPLLDRREAGRAGRTAETADDEAAQFLGLA